MDVLGDYIDAWVLDNSPCAISIGARCMAGEKACGWYWPPNQDPWLVTPDGNTVVFDGSDVVPFLDNTPKPLADVPREKALVGSEPEGGGEDAGPPEEVPKDADLGGADLKYDDKHDVPMDLLEPSEEIPDPSSAEAVASLKEHAFSSEHCV